MNRKFYAIILIILTLIVVLGLAHFIFFPSRLAGTPIALYSSSISPQNTGLISNVFNATQGATEQIALTLTSTMYSPQIEIPIESLKLIAYNKTIDYNNWDTSSWNTSLVQVKVFNYSFSPSQLTLQPNTPNSAIITIKLATNAPTGRYALEINLGKLKFLSPPGKYDLSYSAGVWLGMIVTLKSNANVVSSEQVYLASRD
jgi:hypothetical protein